MKYRTEIDLAIKNLENNLNLFKAVQEKYPDTKIQYVKNNIFKGFLSKSVNNIYTNYEFIEKSNMITVAPYVNFTFTHNDKIENIKIHSIPRYSRLVYIKYNYTTRKNAICFSRLNFNLKNNNFKEDMLNDCRIKILDFVKKHSSLKLDKKHLDPKLDKLLSFI